MCIDIEIYTIIYICIGVELTTTPQIRYIWYNPYVWYTGMCDLL